MADEVWTRAEPQSPCVRVCVMHAEGLCVGCLRTLDEIAGWGAMGAEARAAVLAELPGRRGRLAVRRGGRAGRLAP
jgi:predicted Fe-S protein YdhL (DUF1289 family)